MTIPALDRLAMMPIVMAALLADGATPAGDPDEVGAARILAVTAGRVAGIAVAKEAFGRMGARLRPLVDEGATVASGTAVAELGGPLGAIRAAAPTALGFLSRLSAVAAGIEPPDPAEPLDGWAAEVARLSPHGSVGDDTPSFRLEIEG
jgi:nicotinate-nucleotide pyrophosphorylase